MTGNSGDVESVEGGYNRGGFVTATTQKTRQIQFYRNAI